MIWYTSRTQLQSRCSRTGLTRTAPSRPGRKEAESTAIRWPVERQTQGGGGVDVLKQLVGPPSCPERPSEVLTDGALKVPREQRGNLGDIKSVYGKLVYVSLALNGVGEEDSPLRLLCHTHTHTHPYLVNWTSLRVFGVLKVQVSLAGGVQDRRSAT